MSIQIRNTISPALAAQARKFSNRRPILEAMGTQLVSLTKRAFNDAELRPSPWAPVKKKSGAPLKKSGALFQSIRITSLDNNSVTVGTDRPYAAAQQFGTKPYVIYAKAGKALFWPGARHPVKKVNHPGLPPRPFFPFYSAGRMTPLAQSKIEAVARAKIASMLTS